MDVQVLDIVPTSSAVLIQARSNVGEIIFGSTAVSGRLRVRVIADQVDPAGPVEASMAVPVASLESGQTLYDNELRTRLNALRFPSITAELSGATPLGSDRFSVAGQLTIHGTTLRQACTVSVEVTVADPSEVVVTGTAIIDIRDYDIALPNVLMLKIFPDVSVRFRLTAVPTNATKEEGD